MCGDENVDMDMWCDYNGKVEEPCDEKSSKYDCAWISGKSLT